MKRIPADEKWILAAALLAVFGEHLFLIGYKTYANVDEAYASALASRLLDGQTLYVGAVSQRGPLMYCTFEAFAWIFGWSNVVALRIVTFLLCATMVLLTYWATRVTISRRAAPLAALLTSYAFSFGFPVVDGAALNGELLQAPFLVLSFVFGVFAMRHLNARRLKWLVAAGLSFGIAASIKQSALLHVAPIIVWLAAAHRKKRSGRVVAQSLAVVGASLFVPALFVARALWIGSLREAIYFTVTYNTTIHLRPLPNEHPWVRNFLGATSDNRFFCLGLVFLLAGGGFAFSRRLQRARRHGIAHAWRRFGTNEYLAAHAVIGVASASFLVRFFPHYFVAALPFLAMGVACLIVKIIPPLPAFASRVIVVTACVFTVLSGAITANFLEVSDGRTMETPSVKNVATYIKAITAPDDRIFVWGFSPSLYGYSERRPAGRYLFETYVTGFVPWFWDALPYESARVVPGSVAGLLDDLEREKPKVVVDAGSVMLARSMRAYPEFDAWMHKRLCFLVRIEAFDLYIWNDTGAPCTVAAYPKLHAPEDYIGRRLLVSMPIPLDDATSARLPTGPDHRPLWFPDEPTPPHLEDARDPHVEKELAKERAKNHDVVLPGDDPSAL